MQEVRFSRDFREGEQIVTPHGTITVGPERQTQLSDKQQQHFTESYGQDFFNVDEGLTDEETRGRNERNAQITGPDGVVASTQAYQLSPNPPDKEYEDAATAREAAGKFVNAAMPHHLAAAQAEAQRKAEQRPAPDQAVHETGLSSVEAELGGNKVAAHAQSAALRERAVRRSNRKAFEDGNPEPSTHTSDDPKKDLETTTVADLSGNSNASATG